MLKQKKRTLAFALINAKLSVYSVSTTFSTLAGQKKAGIVGNMNGKANKKFCMQVISLGIAVVNLI